MCHLEWYSCSAAPPQLNLAAGNGLKDNRAGDASIVWAGRAVPMHHKAEMLKGNENWGRGREREGHRERTPTAVGEKKRGTSGGTARDTPRKHKRIEFQTSHTALGGCKNTSMQQQHQETVASKMCEHAAYQQDSNT